MKMCFIILPMFLILLPGCNNEQSSFEIGNKNSSNRILVSGMHSAYKESVLKNAVRKFGTDTIYVKAVPVDSLLKLDKSEYKAVILFNSCYAWNMQGWVYRFLKDNPDADEKVIVFTTSASLAFERWKPSLKVDAISSASKKSNIGKRSDELYAIVNGKLKQPRKIPF